MKYAQHTNYLGIGRARGKYGAISQKHDSEIFNDLDFPGLHQCMLDRLYLQF